MQVTKEGIERIKSANDLAAVVAERGVELKKKGKQLVAPCPFHEEKTASFNVSSAKGLYHCFGCGASGDVIGFVTKHDKVSFGRALETLARRAGLDLERLMEERPRTQRRTPIEALTPPRNGKPAPSKAAAEGAPLHGAPQLPNAGEVLSRVVEHYHRTFCEREDAQAYLVERGITDTDLVQALKIGYADGSLLKVIPKEGELREQLLALGVITPEGRELLGGCIVVPIPDPLTGSWTSLYGRGLKTPRHCYLPGPLRGVVNFQAARTSDEVVLAESIFDALSFHQVGIAIAIPLYGTNGFTPDHLDLLKRERVKRVILALDNDDAGRKATDALKGKLEAAGISVRAVVLPGRDQGRERAPRLEERGCEPRLPPAPRSGRACAAAAARRLRRRRGHVSLKRKDAIRPRAASQLTREGVTLPGARALAAPGAAAGHGEGDEGRGLPRRHDRPLRLAQPQRVRAARGEGARRRRPTRSRRRSWRSSSRPRRRPRRRASEERAHAGGDEREPSAARRSPSSGASDLLDQAARDIDALGYVGEEMNKRLLYLVAVSRKLEDPLSAIVLSPERGREERPHRSHREAVPARGRRAPHAAHAAEPLLHRAGLPRPQARDRRGALRLDRGRLLDPRPAEPEEADRRGTGEGPADGEHADEGLHGRGAGRLHRGDDGELA